MTRGKTTCRILKEIRQQIADANDIEFVTSECRYQGECAGTCPKCEAEVRYLESQLAARQLAGKAVALAGISAAVFLTGCGGKGNAATKVETESAHEIEVAETIVGDVDIRGKVAEENLVDEIKPVEVAVKGDIEAESIEKSVDNVPLPVVGGIEEENERLREMGIEIGGTRHEEPVSDDRVFDVAHQRPRFPDGDAALTEYVQTHIRYPETAKENNIQGRVVVQFVVTKTGEIGEVKVVRGKHPDLDKEAVRLVRSLPEFIPGTINDHPVNVWYTLPIQFQLEGSKASVKVPGKREEWRPPYKSR